jgi:hypothetical protein
MASKDDRKRQKKRRKEDKKHAERAGELQRRAAVEKRRAQYPHVEYDTRGGDPEFVSIVKGLVASFDFSDPTICPPDIQRLYRLQKSIGYPRLSGMFQDLASDIYKDPVTAELRTAELEHPLGGFLGQWLFDRLPEPCREYPLPFHYFCVRPVEDFIGIEFEFLPSQKTDSGTIYYSPAKPRVEFGGASWTVAFSRHAIERACQRVTPVSPISYIYFQMNYIYFRCCTYFEPLEFADGQPAIRLYGECDDVPDREMRLYRDRILGDAYQPGKGKAHYVLGYCPIAFKGGKAVATTFLYPGYSGTPEDVLVRRARIAPPERERLVQAANNNNHNRVLSLGNSDVIKWYHDNGVPQVVQLPRGVVQLDD